MFYEPKNGHGLSHNPLKAIVSPRPIGWISTVSTEGAHNLAPYSYFNLVCDEPPMVMFVSDGWKDSVRNIQETGSFTCNLVSDNLKAQMNASSVNAPRGVSEFAYSGLTPAASQLIAAPRVKEAYSALECVAVEIKQLKDRQGRSTESHMVIGEIVGIHIDEAILSNGMIDTAKARPVARLGYLEFNTVETTYEMIRPRWKDGEG
ncbi:flavin reductase family protein [Daeguia caeni]|uniref:Flavin reductase family protein n=1 Tax=Daeguia caeni TaxID=439612 RepID=A0ABV9H578_9HYPH